MPEPRYALPFGPSMVTQCPKCKEKGRLHYECVDHVELDWGGMELDGEMVCTAPQGSSQIKFLVKINCPDCGLALEFNSRDEWERERAYFLTINSKPTRVV